MFPIVAFFAAYQMYDIYVATAVLIIASLVQTVIHRLQHGMFDKTHLITLILVSVFGGATLIFHDETFIKWKPTVINWIFAIVLIGSQVIFKKNIIASMLGEKMPLPAMVWDQLNLAWALFFVVLGVANLYVAFHFDTSTWVNFKMFGLMGATFAFVILQSLYVSKYLKESPAAIGREKDSQ
ncbi:MAG: septation protein A [Zetaproteobacteria bacterium]|nr:septation protein A [Zetaproteobacteria bacterium]